MLHIFKTTSKHITVVEILVLVWLFCWGFGVVFFVFLFFFNVEVDLKLIRRNRLNPMATSPGPFYPNMCRFS